MNYQNKTVLFVDDERNVTEGILRQLRKEPYKLMSASSAKEALQIIQKEKVDVVITDEHMPIMTGAELVSQIRKDYPHIICMILSGQEDFNAAIKSINDGDIYRYLKKPCDPISIATDIRLALKQQGQMIQLRKIIDNNKGVIEFEEEIQKVFPEIFDIKVDESGCVIIDDDE